MNKIKHNILGTIPQNWSVVKFNTVVELIHGYQFRTNDFTEEGVKVFKITQIKGDGIIDISNCDFISSNRLDNFKKNIISYNDILMALTGATIGKIARFKSQEITLQNYRVGKFTSSNKNVLSEDYLYYFLSSKLFVHQLLARQTQSAQQNIGKEDINNMTICYPDLPTQTAIAEILSSLDDKIELNDKINAELEALAQALFKQWFIDFEFPNENGDPYKSSGGEMVDSELGEIPKGWVNSNFGQLCNLSTGKGINKSQYKNDGEYPVIGANGTMGYFDNYNIDGFNILTGRVGTLGTVRINIVKAWTSDNVIVCKPKNKFFGYYSYYIMSNFNFDGLNRGSTQPLITQTDLKEEICLIPNIQKLEIFENTCSSIFQLVFANQSENQFLGKMRDTMLPLLISGEIEVKEDIT